MTFAVTGHDRHYVIQHCHRSGTRTDIAVAAPGHTRSHLSFLRTGADLGIAPSAEMTFRAGLHAQTHAMADLDARTADSIAAPQGRSA
ncbi:hypothetical protein LO763_20175 [Glycomyces sp. A-F 0318]|uniref:hypothetical protein n=1 Tax=Glycomyces amatae TaxID=2881355 RepID=UPI001E47FDB4|nr:hypothetical protein [Glycomyces amatae]MCD0445932.1 hypothetical protein [Glycomyces amatae]